jgi:lysozyme
MEEMNAQQLMAQLNIDEGRRKRIYPDTKGKITGGVGRNLSDRDFSEDEIDLMLQNDVRIVLQSLDKTYPWWRGMTEARQQVLANMTFNLGLPKLSAFKKFLAALQSGRWEMAADEMMNSQWASDVGDRAVRLAKHMREG